jgi:hypothetical protein
MDGWIRPNAILSLHAPNCSVSQVLHRRSARLRLLPSKSSTWRLRDAKSPRFSINLKVSSPPSRLLLCAADVHRGRCRRLPRLVLRCRHRVRRRPLPAVSRCVPSVLRSLTVQLPLVLDQAAAVHLGLPALNRPSCHHNPPRQGPRPLPARVPRLHLPAGLPARPPDHPLLRRLPLRSGHPHPALAARRTPLLRCPPAHRDGRCRPADRDRLRPEPQDP